MEQLTLKATPRDLLGKKVKIMRGKNQIPAVCYGQKIKPLSLTISKRELLMIAKQAGEATIINLEIPQKETLKVLIRDLQRHPLTDEIIHADFYNIDLSKAVQTEIPLEFVGASKAVEELEGNLITNKDSIKVECLPDKLVSKIEVDVSVLKTFEDLIHVGDLNISEGIKVLDEAEDIIAQVTPPRSEEELKAIEEEAAVDTEKAQIEDIEAKAEVEKAQKEEAKEGEEPTEKPQTEPLTPAHEKK